MSIGLSHNVQFFALEANSNSFVDIWATLWTFRAGESLARHFCGQRFAPRDASIGDSRENPCDRSLRRRAVENVSISALYLWWVVLDAPPNTGVPNDICICFGSGALYLVSALDVLASQRCQSIELAGACVRLAISGICHRLCVKRLKSLRPANKTVQATPMNATVLPLRSWAGLCHSYGVPDPFSLGVFTP